MEKKIKKREKVGKISSDLLLRPDEKQGVIDTQREMTKGYIGHIEDLVTTGECRSWHYPFYIQVIQRRERLMVNAIRHHFVARKTLPEPGYDQDVWKYFPSTGDLKYLWSVPDQESVSYMLSIIPTKEQQQLHEYCVHFVNGTLEQTFGE